MSAKYSALLEACDKVQLTGKLGILEESSLDEATSIKMKLVLNENINFIKQQLFRTPLVENIQANLGARWTQAILEDIDVDGDTQTAFMKNISGLKDDTISGFKTIGEKLAPIGSKFADEVNYTAGKITDAGAGLVNKVAETGKDINATVGEKVATVGDTVKGITPVSADQYNAMQGSQQALANDHAALAQQTSGYGAQAGMALDKSLAANPIATNTALGSAAGLAGYGAYKLGQKVFRRR